MGKKDGIETGEELGVEEGRLQGYVSAFKETHDKDCISVSDEYWTDSSTDRSIEKVNDTRENLLDFSTGSINSPFDIENQEISIDEKEQLIGPKWAILKKRIKIITKFYEFHFAKRNPVAKRTNPASKILAEFLNNKLS